MKNLYDPKVPSITLAQIQKSWMGVGMDDLSLGLYDAQYIVSN